MSLLYDQDTGQPLGFWYEADDGARVATDFDGQVLGAVDAGGQPIDHSAYEVVENPTAFQQVTEDRAAAAARDAARQAAQEAWRAHEIETALADEELELIRAASDVADQFASVERQLGRPLTAAEANMLGERLREYHDHGRELDVDAALKQLEAERQPLHDTSTHNGRVKYGVQLWEEQERVARGEDPVGPPAPSQAEYDMANHNDRVAWALDKANGADVDDRRFNSAATTDAASPEGE